MELKIAGYTLSRGLPHAAIWIHVGHFKEHAGYAARIDIFTSC